MTVKPSVKPICEKCKVIKRKGLSLIHILRRLVACKSPILSRTC